MKTKKNKFKGIIPLLIILVVSCNQSVPELVDVDTSYKEQVEQLNAKYREIGIKHGKSSGYMGKFNSISEDGEDDNNDDDKAQEDKDTKELKTDGQSIMENDATGLSQGAILGFYLFGGFSGAVVGGVSCAVFLSVMDYLYQTQSISIIDYDKTNLYIGSPSESTLFTNVDRRQPINEYHLSEGLVADSLGMNFGKIHNFVITQLFTNPSYKLVNCNSIELLNRTIDVLKDYQILNVSCDYSVINQLYDNSEFISKIENINKDSIKAIINSEMFNLSEFYSISMNLDSFQLSNYTSEYSEIVNRAYRDNYLNLNTTMLINGYMSVYSYSRSLWRNYMPDPDFIKDRFVYNILDNTAHYFTSFDDFDNYINANQNSYWGIPHIVNGKVSEIYFYKGGYGYNSGLNDSAYIDGLLNFENSSCFTNLDVVWDNIKLPSEVSLQAVPHTGNKIYYVRLYN